MNALNDDMNHKLIRKTREVWQPRMGRSLDDDEAQRIASNFSGVFSILIEWERAEADARKRAAQRRRLKETRRT